MPRLVHRILLLTRIVSNTIPIVVMILLVPIVENDYVLTIIYCLMIFLALKMRKRREDYLYPLFGFFASLGGEALFIATGVETFERKTLFGIMPLWLPFLWAYIFIAFRNTVVAFEKYIPSNTLRRL